MRVESSGHKPRKARGEVVSRGSLLASDARFWEARSYHNKRGEFELRHSSCEHPSFVGCVQERKGYIEKDVFC